MFIYQISAGFGEADLAFSSLRKARERVLINLRGHYGTHDAHILGQITGKSLDWNNHLAVYKYNATIKDCGNLRYLDVKFYSPISPTLSMQEIFVKYPVADDVDLINRQLEDYSHSNPRWVYFNYCDSLDFFHQHHQEVMRNPLEEFSQKLLYRAYFCKKT